MATMHIRVVYTGRRYQLAEQLPPSLNVPEGTRLSQALAQLQAGLAADEQLSDACLVAVSGQHVGSLSRLADRPLQDGDEIMLIAPVAGG